jgi:hypothetical protein
VKSTVLLYEAKPKYDAWFKYMVFGIPAFTLMVGFIIAYIDIKGAWILFGVTVFYILLFWAILPRSYQIYEDRLNIKLGAPFAFTVSLASIQEANKATGYYTFAFWGVRFATSASNVVEIKRRRWMSVIISPSNADTFIERLNAARQSLADGN